MHLVFVAFHIEVTVVRFVDLVNGKIRADMGAYLSQGNTYATNDFELVIRTSKELEFLLENQFHAEGKGLHEKITSASSSALLPDSLVRKMRFLATIRNKLIHDTTVNAIPDRAAFIHNFEEAKRELQAVLDRMSQNRGSGGGATPLTSCTIA